MVFLSIFFSPLCFLFIVQLCVAENSPQDYLDAHNAARAEVGVAALTWDNEVAAYASNYTRQRAGDCKLVHSNGPYGENLAWSSGDMSATDAVKLWVDEKAYYNPASNSCDNGRVCGHYTQVVWRDTESLGCARVRCYNGGTFFICNYDPPGNFIGERPYHFQKHHPLCSPKRLDVKNHMPLPRFVS